jgi:putative glutamine amidotransferase
MSPLIALAGRYGAPSRVSRDAVAFAGRRYLDAILRAGGEPVVISPQPLTTHDAEAMMRRFNGLVLMGGADVNPSLYGQTAGPHIYGVQPEQDSFEISLLNAALNLDLPVLAVCRGMQLANVVLGGSLVQHLGELANASDLLAHAPKQFPVGEEFALHQVNIEPGSKMALALGATQIKGASFHHQGIAELASDLIAVGHAPDGILEAVEHRTKWLLGMQWHPEDTAATDSLQQNLYNAFVKRARELLAAEATI